MKEINYNFREKFLGSAPVKESQTPREFQRYLDTLDRYIGVSDTGFTQSYLEVGAYAGESLYYMSQYLSRGSAITLIDLGDNGLARRILTDIVIPHCRNTYNHTISLINGFSNAPSTIDAAGKLAPTGGRYDLVFIDANHTFRNSLEDFSIYRHMGNYVAFHDIADATTTKATIKHGVEQANVNHLWRAIKELVPEGLIQNELVREYDAQWHEFIDETDPKGIGLLWQGWTRDHAN
jgi:predicted O-methyltransferase YrrM